MVNKILITQQDGTPKSIVYADFAGDFGPTAANDLQDATAGNITEVQVNYGSLSNGAARQAVKVDLGTDRAQEYAVRAAIEFAATPVAGDIVEFFWAPSQSATAGTANPGGVDGTNSVYTGYSSNKDESIHQLQYIGQFVCTVQITTTVQIAEVGEFRPRERYGCLVILNDSGAAFHTDDVETHVVLDPIVMELQ